MQFAEKQLEYHKKLSEMGHQAYVTHFAAQMVGKTDEEKETMKLHQKNELDAIRAYWQLMQGKDAILVVNFDKHGIKNYIGGNSFLEIGFAFVMGQKIYFLNPIPEISFYNTEIEAMQPVIINGDLRKIK